MTLFHIESTHFISMFKLLHVHVIVAIYYDCTEVMGKVTDCYEKIF